MYLVELRPGKEELYRTGDDLAAAIRSGEVDGHSRIYHRSTSKWISITLHPQYKAIVAEKPAKPADRNGWTYLTDQAETLESSVAEPEADADDGAGERSPTVRRGRQGDSPWRRPVTLGISGLFLVFGIQLAFSGPRPSWSASAAAKPSRERRPRRPRPSRPSSSQVVSLASTSTGWSEGAGYPRRRRPTRRPRRRRRRPCCRGRRGSRPSRSTRRSRPATAETEVDGKTIEGLLVGYGKAYETARDRLGSGMRVARLEPALRPDPAHARRRRHRHPARPRRASPTSSGCTGSRRARSSASSRTRSRRCRRISAGRPRRRSGGTPARRARSRRRWCR